MELRSKMTKEVDKVDQNYFNLYTKIDIVVDVVMKIVEFCNSLLTKFNLKSESDSKHFVKLEELLRNVKELISKLVVSASSLVSQESFSQMFSLLESNLRVDLAPLLKLVNFMPSDAPLIKIGVQEREKCGGSSVSKGVDTGSSNDHSQGSAIRKVMSTQLPTLLPTSLSTTSTIMNSNPLTKGITIGSSAGGSNSKPPPLKKEMEGKGKGINTDPTKEDKKIVLEKEIVRQRQIESILRQGKEILLVLRWVIQPNHTIMKQSNRLFHLVTCMIV
ncbi:unnamed protein product [Lactuca saligna]|uniref:Uncharacterized protein n=1 Tax=Lactuca saligna TaxID=75948 RepID=A0AA35YEY9_LACSI|nr:unnamed protein product [Lactuca saligna]